METVLTEFELPGGSTILVEAAEAGGPAVGVERIARADELGVKAVHGLEDAFDSVRPGIEEIVAKIKAMSAQADEIQVAFGLTLSGKVGAFVTAGAEANFDVTLTWKKT